MPEQKRRIKDCVILIGYDADGGCVYSEQIGLDDYYDGEHVWDDPSSVVEIGMAKLVGFIFSPDSDLDQEFESMFNAATGVYESGRTRFADGTIQVQ